MTSSDTELRPRCYHCGAAYAGDDRHTKPVSCACPRCDGMPACYSCRNMYCPCEAHEHG